MLTKVLSGDFAEIVTVWRVNEETAYSWLKRIYLRIESEEGLDESIQAFAGLTIDHDSALVFGTLRTYMEARFNRQLTTDVVRQELPTFGLSLKHWELDTTLTERLRESTYDYLNELLLHSGRQHDNSSRSGDYRSRPTNPTEPRLFFLRCA